MATSSQTSPDARLIAAAADLIRRQLDRVGPYNAAEQTARAAAARTESEKAVADAAELRAAQADAEAGEDQ